MIKTKQIKSISTKIPENTQDTVYINVLTWHDQNHVNGSKYSVFSPYKCLTDGQEEQHNFGNVLFENFWQGSKLWPTYYDCEVWAHPNLKGKDEKYMWFKYKCASGLGSEKHLIDNVIQPEYYRWKAEIFNCPRPVRYPNGYSRRSKVAFSLLVDKHGNQKRLDYIEARKQIYIKEYSRLIRKMPEFDELKCLLNDKKKRLIICEIDVPDDEVITLDKLEQLVEDRNIRFGHGLCLAWELLKEIKPVRSPPTI